jgi:hypothetical protein
MLCAIFYIRILSSFQVTLLHPACGSGGIYEFKSGQCDAGFRAQSHQAIAARATAERKLTASLSERVVGPADVI